MSHDSEWQELAAQGHAVEAIRAYCAGHGVGLAEAKAAVERWRAVNFPPSPAFQRAFRVARRLTDALLEYLGDSEPRSFQVRILPADPKDAAGQNTRFFSDQPPDRPTLDLAVEVAMEGAPAALARDVGKGYVANGARVCWVVESEARTVRVYRPDAPAEELDEGAAIDGGDVLPGFSCKVAELFG